MNIQKNNYSILVLDDSNVIRSLLGITLRKAGYEVDCAESVSQAENLLSQKSYDMWILDYMIDLNHTGFDLIQRIKATGTTLPPIIMLSAESSSTHEQSIRSLGIQAWMKKPFTPKNILETISKIQTIHSE